MFCKNFGQNFFACIFFGCFVFFCVSVNGCKGVGPSACAQFLNQIGAAGGSVPSGSRCSAAAKTNDRGSQKNEKKLACCSFVPPPIRGGAPPIFEALLIISIGRQKICLQALPKNDRF